MTATPPETPNTELDRLRRVSAALHVLSEATAAFAEATLDSQRLGHTIARIVTQAIGDSCAVQLVEEETQQLRLVTFFHPDPVAQEQIGAMFSALPLRVGEGVMGRVAQTQVSFLQPRLDFSLLLQSTKPEYRDLVARYPAHSVLVVPLKARGRTLGVLALARYGPSAAYGEEELRLVEDLAERAALALEISQLVEREREAGRRARVLADASLSLQHRRPHAEVLELLVGLGASALGDGCVMTLLEEGTLKTVAARHRSQSAQEALQRVIGEPLPLEALTHQVLKEGKALRLVDASGYRSSLASGESYRQGVGMASMVICPLRVEGESIGTLGVSRDRGGRPYGEADEVFLQDLADRAALVVHNARLYERAERARAEAEKASRLKDDFLSVAGHELRTPLAALRLNLQSLRQQEEEREPGSAVVQRLEKVERQSGRLVKLVQELLDVTRITDGRLQLSPERFDLGSLLAEVLDRYSGKLASSGSALSVDAAPGVLGHWDRTRLDQVLTNLLDNAIKYGSGKPISVRLSARDGVAELEVRDGGIGIPVSEQERIFGRFERAVSPRNFGGLGLGLWISRQLVEAMGGTIGFQSAEGSGSTFTVHLPQEPAPTALSKGLARAGG